jgi:hypothetical protein
VKLLLIAISVVLLISFQARLSRDVSYILIVEDSVYMKKIIIGCFLSGFLLLITPCVNSIEYQNQKNLVTSGMGKMDYASFVNMVNQIPKDEWRALLKDKVHNFTGYSMCEILFILFLVFLILVVTIYLAYIVWNMACFLNCDFTGPFLKTDAPCTSCAFEELMILIQLHSKVPN